MEIIEYVPNQYSGSILRKKTSNVCDINSTVANECINKLNRVLDNLIDEKSDYKCCGISAPQIGYALAISILYDGKQRYVMLNPTIENKGPTKKLFSVECHSLGKQRAMIECFDCIKVSYFDQSNNKKNVNAVDEFAMLIQHHIDHLNGILMFERTKGGKDGLFIPRENHSDYIPIKNYGLIMNIRQKFGLVEVQSAVQYYSFLFNYDIDYHGYIAQAAIKRKEYVDIIEEYSTHDMRLLEAGCGTSSISIGLSKKGYNITCIDIDSNMINLASIMCNRENGKVNYRVGDIRNLDYDDGYFDLVFSHGVIEHFSEDDKIRIIKEGLRVAKTYIISVPTIWDVSNCWLGDEILWTVLKWKRFFKVNGFLLIDYKKSFPMRNNLKKLNDILKMVPPSNAIFVIKKGNSNE